MLTLRQGGDWQVTRMGKSVGELIGIRVQDGEEAVTGGKVSVELKLFCQRRNETQCSSAGSSKLNSHRWASMRT